MKLKETYVEVFKDFRHLLASRSTLQQVNCQHRGERLIPL